MSSPQRPYVSILHQTFSSPAAQTTPSVSWQFQQASVTNVRPRPRPLSTTTRILTPFSQHGAGPCSSLSSLFSWLRCVRFTGYLINSRLLSHDLAFYFVLLEPRFYSATASDQCIYSTLHYLRVFPGSSFWISMSERPGG